MTRLRHFLNCREPLGRGGYFFAGVLLCAIKYNIDRILMWYLSGQRWSPLDYTKVGEYGFLASQAGQFNLVRLEDGRTWLEGKRGISITCGLPRIGVGGRITSFIRFTCACCGM